MQNHVDLLLQTTRISSLSTSIMTTCSMLLSEPLKRTEMSSQLVYLDKTVRLYILEITLSAVYM